MSLGIKNHDLIKKELSFFIDKYKHIPSSKLESILSISTSAKNSFSVLAERLFATSGLDEFIKETIGVWPRLKTIRTDVCGRVKESMSLPTFKYCEIVQEHWESSCLRNYFLNNVFVFLVFQCQSGEFFLNKAILWKMPEEILESEVRRVWDLTRELLECGSIVKYIAQGNRYFTYFPASSDSYCVHVRPHAQSKQDTYPLPTPDRLTGLDAYPKHSFWINSSFVQKIISRNLADEFK